MADVILVGTSHKYQIRGGAVSQGDGDQFEQLLISLCSEYTAKGIAEEMNQVALAERDVSDTIAQEVAVALRIEHQLSDPTPELRQQLGIRGENDIRVDGWLKNWSSERIEAEVRKSHEVRESYWLAQLRVFDSWPVVFICGANHLEPFAALLGGSGYEIVVSVPDWVPNH